jgi:hypothetical protein
LEARKASRFVPDSATPEVFNPSTADEAFFLSVHAPHEGYDFVPGDFRQVAAALHDREYVASQRSVERDVSP